MDSLLMTVRITRLICYFGLDCMYREPLDWLRSERVYDRTRYFGNKSDFNDLNQVSLTSCIFFLFAVRHVADLI